MINEILDVFGNIIANNYQIGILIAFLAGIVTVFTPCSLTSGPILISYIGASGNTKKKAFIYSLFIALGQIITFVILGIIAGSLNILMGLGGKIEVIWQVILAFIMIIMSLEIIGLTSFIGKGNKCKIKPSETTTKKGLWGAFLVGGVGALFSTPCSVPILIAMLGYVSLSGGGILMGGAMLLSYAIGFSLLYIIGGISIGALKQLNNTRAMKFAYVFKVILAIFVFLLGVYLLYNGLFQY